METRKSQDNTQFWQDYRVLLHRFIINRINDPIATEDILQDVLLKAFRHLHTVNDKEKVRSWMYQITRNTIVDYYRQRDQRNLNAALSLDETTEDGIKSGLASCLIPMIKQLSQPYQQALMLSEIEGLTQKEVAQKQEVSLSGAKSRIQRGRKMLKAMLLDCCRVELSRQGSVIDFEPKKGCHDC